MSWLVSIPVDRARAEVLTGDMPELAAIDPAPVIAASEEDEAADRWRIDAYFERKPATATVRLLASLCGVDALPAPRRLADQDWVTISQQGLDPVRAGRFHVHTANDAPLDAPAVVNLRIDAGQAFGTGHHQTTAGCLALIDRLAASGRRFRDVADIGTGTGLLAFAALALWPRARATASDIDPVSIAVTADNAAVNGVPLGRGTGAVALTVADGTASPLIRARAPYDLIIANILAGPLIALAPALAAIAEPGTTLILAGLIARQRPAVARAYRLAGFRLDDAGSGDWPALRLTMRRRHGWRRPLRSRGTGGLPPGDFGSW